MTITPRGWRAFAREFSSYTGVLCADSPQLAAFTGAFMAHSREFTSFARVFTVFAFECAACARKRAMPLAI